MFSLIANSQPSNSSLSPSIEKRLKILRKEKRPLNLDDVHFLIDCKKNLDDYQNFTSEAYHYLMQNNLLSLEQLIKCANFEQFKQLLFYHSPILSIHSKIPHINKQTKQEEFHSFYYFVNDKKILFYLYENGLDIHENFLDLCEQLTFYHFYDIFNIELITAEMFTQFLIDVDYNCFGADRNNLKKDYNFNYLGFIERILTYHNYFQLDQLCYLYDIYDYTNNEFLKEYFQKNLTLNILEQCFKTYLEEDIFASYTRLLELCALYGFERLKSEGLIVHEKLINYFFEAEKKNEVSYAETIYRYVIKLKKLKYPEMEEIKEIYAQEIRALLAKKNREIEMTSGEEKIFDFENIEDLKAYVKKHDTSKMNLRDDIIKYLKTYLSI